MKSTVVKRSIAVGGHKTSVSLEEPFHEGDFAAAPRDAVRAG
jgi:predicted DNA-binding ribbon-helix-helix protein